MKTRHLAEKNLNKPPMDRINGHSYTSITAKVMFVGWKRLINLIDCRFPYQPICLAQQKPPSAFWWLWYTHLFLLVFAQSYVDWFGRTLSRTTFRTATLTALLSTVSRSLSIVFHIMIHSNAIYGCPHPTSVDFESVFEQLLAMWAVLSVILVKFLRPLSQGFHSTVATVSLWLRERLSSFWSLIVIVLFPEISHGKEYPHGQQLQSTLQLPHAIGFPKYFHHEHNLINRVAVASCRRHKV